MTHTEIRNILDNAPPSTEARIVYFHSIYAQIFGWIADPDKLWLCKFLPEIAKGFPERIRILEIGAFNGGTSRGLIALTGGTLTCIDNFVDFSGEGVRSLAGAVDGPSAFWETLKHSPDLSAHVKDLIVGNSQNVGQTWNEPINLVLFDADHHTDPFKTDLSLFCPHVVPGGYCLLDDWDMDSVKLTAEEFFDKEKWEVIRVPTEPTAKLSCVRKKM